MEAVAEQMLEGSRVRDLEEAEAWVAMNLAGPRPSTSEETEMEEVEAYPCSVAFQVPYPYGPSCALVRLTVVEVEGA